MYKRAAEKIQKIRTRKNQNQTQKAHALEHVHMKYVLYGILILFLGGLTYVFAASTKDRESKQDVLGVQTQDGLTECTGQTKYHTAHGRLENLNFDKRAIAISKDGDTKISSYILAGEVKLYDASCKRVPARSFTYTGEVTYYYQNQTVFVVEAQ